MKHCQTCRKELPRDSRRSRKFCDDACRLKYHRTKSAQTLYSDAITTISKFSKVSASEKQQAIKNLKDLQTIIKHELYLLGDFDEVHRVGMLGDIDRKRDNLT